MMHVLIHVQDAHDVGATRGLPVVLHLLPGLGAVVQELWEVGTQGVRLALTPLPLLRETCGLPKHQTFIYEERSENSNPVFPALQSSEPLDLRGQPRAQVAWSVSLDGHGRWVTGQSSEVRKVPTCLLRGKMK